MSPDLPNSPAISPAISQGDAALHGGVRRVPILVTGAHRTGTTWVGKMLAASGQAAYISEPMNVLHRAGVLHASTKYWYTYICRENEAEYLPAFQEMLSFDYHVWAELTSLHSPKDVLRMGRDSWTFLMGKLQRQRPLLKDPFALFSIPWFIQRLDCQVVITLRHPAAFASSLKRLNWTFQFSNLLNQPLLIRDWLEPFESEIAELDSASGSSPEGQPDIIAQASLLWRILYTVAFRFKELYPQIQLARHEDLSLEPLAGFHTLYETLGLNFTRQAQETILKSSSSENPQEASGKNIFTTRLDSRASLQNWKRRLTDGEMQRIRQLTESTAALFYPDYSWD